MTEEVHPPGAVAVIARNERLLVIRRSRHVVAPGAFCFPGGGIEPGESEAAAIVREIEEELTATVRPVRRLWQSTTPWNVMLHWWLAELVGEQEPVANPQEVESVHWLKLEEIATLDGLLPSNRLFLAALKRGEFSLNLEQ